MQGFINPEEILNQLKLKEDMIAADFGSGSGGWAIPLAKILKEGKVYAIDVLEEALSALKGKTEISKTFNIIPIRSNIEEDKGSKIQSNHADLVLLTNLLFEVEDKTLVFFEANRVLKKGGKILVVDWKEASPIGPKEGRISAKDVVELAQDLDLKQIKEFKAGNYHYCLLFEKP
ncbi:class I SAM-dependent methyltransferase [Patescibacteria group bacterium]